jgi:hypothetical protein
VNSQLSAIPEVDEDSTHKSSSLSVHSSVDKSQHFQLEGKHYSNLGAMLDNDRASVCSEEPNLFSALDNRSQNSKIQSQEWRTKNDEDTIARTTTESIKNCLRDPMTKEKRRDNKNFHFKGEVITVASNGDDDSTSGISDITYDCLPTSATPPWFKKAMEMFKEVPAEEEGSDAGVAEESRDDLDDLKQLVTLQID